MERSSESTAPAWLLIILALLFFGYQLAEALEPIPIEKVRRAPAGDSVNKADPNLPPDSAGVKQVFEPPCMAEVSFLCQDDSLRGELPCEAKELKHLDHFCKQLKKRVER